MIFWKKLFDDRELDELEDKEIIINAEFETEEEIETLKNSSE